MVVLFFVFCIKDGSITNAIINTRSFRCAYCLSTGLLHLHELWAEAACSFHVSLCSWVLWGKNAVSSSCPIQWMVHGQFVWLWSFIFSSGWEREKILVLYLVTQNFTLVVINKKESCDSLIPSDEIFSCLPHFILCQSQLKNHSETAFLGRRWKKNR